jgi:hypothetical protein
MNGKFKRIHLAGSGSWPKPSRETNRAGVTRELLAAFGEVGRKEAKRDAKMGERETG